MIGPTPGFIPGEPPPKKSEKSPNAKDEPLEISKIKEGGSHVHSSNLTVPLKARSLSLVSNPTPPVSKAAQKGSLLEPVRPGSMLEHRPSLPAAQKPKSISKESLEIARRTDWSKVEVNEEEAQAYLQNLDNHHLDRDSHAFMRGSTSVALPNGKTLTAGEHAALKYYTQHGDTFVNALLTNSPDALFRAANQMNISLTGETEKEILLHCRMICSALNKLPPSDQPELFRGALLTPEHFESYMEAWRKKEMVNEAQILSTSSDMGVSGRFIQIKMKRVCDRYRSDLQEAQRSGKPEPKKPDFLPILFVILQNGSGKEIDAYSQTPDELEVTFVPGAKFKVMKILENTNLPSNLQETFKHVIILEKG